MIILIDTHTHTNTQVSGKIQRSFLILKKTLSKLEIEGNSQSLIKGI